MSDKLKSMLINLASSKVMRDQALRSLGKGEYSESSKATLIRMIELHQREMDETVEAICQYVTQDSKE